MRSGRVNDGVSQLSNSREEREVNESGARVLEHEAIGGRDVGQGAFRGLKEGGLLLRAHGLSSGVKDAREGGSGVKLLGREVDQEPIDVGGSWSMRRRLLRAEAWKGTVS